MANLVAMNMKRKDAEDTNHGLAVFLEPKRIKLQDGKISEMMEEEKPLVDTPTANVPIKASWVPPQGQEAAQDMGATACGGKSSEPPFRADEATATPMDVEMDVRQCQPQMQPCQQAPFWSGFF